MSPTGRKLLPAFFLALLAGVPRVAAQTLPIDPNDCSAALKDPLCVPTATCTAFGNDPAIYNPADVATVPSCPTGVVLGPTNDANGTPRYACLFEPATASTSNPLPLLVFIHPSLVTADGIAATDLLTHLSTGDLTGDPARPGFILLAPEGRKTCHYYPVPDDRQYGWDNWYRNLDPNSPAENVDAATIDGFIAGEVATGKVDPQRIFVTGWSNGSAMGYLYALHRPNVAAAALYSSPDPFRAFNDPCPQVPVAGPPSGLGEIQVPNFGVPTYHVHNDCDIAGICPNGERLEASLNAIGGSADHTLINSLMLPANQCDASCGTDPNADINPCTDLPGYSLGVANHLRWPLLYTTGMLNFLRDHPLGAGVLPLAVTKAKLHGQAPGAGNGSVSAAGTFATSPPSDVLDASASITVTVRDSLSFQQTYAFSTSECAAQAGSGRVGCRSTDRRFSASFKPTPRGSSSYRFKLAFKKLAIDGPFAGPVRVSVVYGSGPTTRAGSPSRCRAASGRLSCRR